MAKRGGKAGNEASRTVIGFVSHDLRLEGQSAGEQLRHAENGILRRSQSGAKSALLGRAVGADMVVAVHIDGLLSQGCHLSATYRFIHRGGD